MMKIPENIERSAHRAPRMLRRLARRALRSHSISHSMRSMGKGSWTILAVLLVLLIATTVISYLGWMSAAGTDVPASGYAALVIGVVCSLAVGCGLMALVFYSSRGGYDEPVRLVQLDDTSTDPRP